MREDVVMRLSVDEGIIEVAKSIERYEMIKCQHCGNVNMYVAADEEYREYVIVCSNCRAVVNRLYIE